MENIKKMLFCSENKYSGETPILKGKMKVEICSVKIQLIVATTKIEACQIYMENPFNIVQLRE